MQTIRRGTTPTVTCGFDFGQQEVEALYITFAQDGKEIFTKELSEMMWEEDGISFRLSQEDTLKFQKGEIDVQVRLKLFNGIAMGSNKVPMTVTDILKEGVI